MPPPNETKIPKAKNKTTEGNKGNEEKTVTSEKIPPTVDLVEAEYKRLFAALDRNADGFILTETFLSILRDCGILEDDPRIQETINSVRLPNTQKRLDYEQFRELARHNSSLIKSAIQGSLAIPDFRELTDEVREIYEKVKQNRSGKVADYIPQLARVNPENLAISICTIDGQRFSIGESKAKFCLQSTCKPINYCLSLEEFGEEKVHKHVGREPSGRGFNELSLNKEGLPHNPMINAGAIMTCSLIKPKMNEADRFDYVLKTWTRLTGNGYVSFNNPVFLSERQTADRNFALGYFMRENKAFPEGTDLPATLEFYFQCCSIETNAESLAIAAGALANGGVCPTTGDRVFQPQTVQNCLSLMSSCGMYDFSGEFAFTIGLPAKSGVSGALLLVVPQVLGICIWSPRLDSLGNSVRGVEFCKSLVSRYNFHQYDSLTSGLNNKRDPRLKKNQTKIEGVVSLCWAASQGDLSEVQRLAALGVDLNSADYDGRTALHLAASEGHAHVVEYLVSKNVNLNPLDRWNGTPLTDARKGNFHDVVKILEEAEKKPG